MPADLRGITSDSDAVSNLRERVAALESLLAARSAGRTIVCTSSTRPVEGLYVGLQIFESDTTRLLQWSGAVWLRAAHVTSTGRTAVSASIAAGTAIGASASISPVVWNTVTADGGDAWGSAPLTAPATGPYLIRASGALAAGNSAQTLIAAGGLSVPLANTAGNLGCVWVGRLQAGDSITVTVTNLGAATSISSLVLRAELADTGP